MRGHDIGESSALALYAVLQMVNSGVTGDYVVILPDGVEKHRKRLEPEQEAGKDSSRTSCQRL